jgi:hypothetical protein
MIDKIIVRCQVIEKLAAGGMGEAYWAHHTTLDQQVGIKMLPEDAKAHENGERGGAHSGALDRFPSQAFCQEM